MSSDIAISVRGLGKSYTIAHDRERHVTLAEAALSRLRHPLRRNPTETFHALKDVSFDIRQGDVVGIIGRNGAGKSTLLKVLSRITEPTAGEIDVYGRVGSLLEVGTGFHPELTGRENIFLNGAILGMSKAEIRKQFDAIVDFAGVEQFLDTPVKRYSSGMYVRLAFAVAAHLESEILVVDEVLAVGDAEFQKKCLGKMKDVSTNGRTVLFVSHSMQAISTLCTKALVLASGRLDYCGTVAGGIARYLSAGRDKDANDESAGRRPGSGEYRFERVVPSSEYFDPADEKVIRFRVRKVRGDVSRMYLSALLVNHVGVNVAQFDSRLVGCWLPDQDVFEGELRFRQPWPKPGPYQVDFYLCTSGNVVDRFDGACRFHVTDVLPYENCVSEDGYRFGLTLPEFEWHACGRGDANERLVVSAEVGK